ncbi:hypothetical protein BKA66DRAFT_223697 [Pyrenochaeta sp. MPI-SDFR-AT-0127]|nr:hypothetical protein BKA66DRAFT_223697 [Pyrenochaeta sp. MPI-SDFR-AT-0127]
MSLPWSLHLWHLFLLIAPVFAEFSQFQFAGNNGNSSAKRTCPGSPFACNPPSVCAFDDRIKKYYCCIPGRTDGVCWTGSPKCDGGSSNTPSGGQQACSSGSNRYCCAKESETCTETSNQINICWSTLENRVAPLNATRVNETFFALSSASPSAASYTISPESLLALTSTTPASSATSPSSPTSDSASAVSSVLSSVSSPGSTPTFSAPTSSPGGGGGTSGGTIGGIVGGVVGGLALAGIAGIFVWRRRKSRKNNLGASADPYSAHGYQSGHMGINELSSQTAPVEKYAHDGYGYPHQGPVAEAPNNERPVEMPANPVKR